MRHRILVALALLTAAMGPLLAQDARNQAWQLLRSGQELTRAGRYDEAEKAILQARDLDPKYPEVYANLGYLYATRGDRGRAVDAYGQLLVLRPDHEYGREAFKKLFFDGQFPRILRAPLLALSPVAFTTDEVRLLTPAGEVKRGLAYTNSLLFHEDMPRGGSPVSVPLPVTSAQASALVNRSCYGFVLPADSDRYTMAFNLAYPSATISAKGEDYLALATRLQHLMLRFYWYGRAYLGRDVPKGLPVKCVMFETGPAGASNYQNAIYYYDVGSKRSPLEWAREVGHEMGHLVLPEVGTFTRPESFASGFLGERLFLQYLALEAGLVAGDPWPSPAAQQALAGLWPGEDLKLQEYLVGNCRTSLDYWAAAGPDSPLASATAEDGMQYFIGLMLWVQATYGQEVLGETLRGAAGTAPADYMVAFRQVLKKRAATGPLVVQAGGLNLPGSKLTDKPLEGALGRTQVRLSPGDTAAFHVYLPEGAWALSTTPAAPGLSLTLDGKGPLPLEAGVSLSLGRMTDGWHKLQLQAAADAKPLPLEQLTFKRVPEA